MAKKKSKNKPAKTEKEKKTLKERLTPGDIEIPACIHTQTMRFYVIAVGIVIVGAALAYLSFDLYLTIGIAALAIIAAAVGFFRELNITHKGFLVMEGVCEKVEFTLGSQAVSTLTGGRSKETPSRYIISSEGELYAIPYFKQNPVLDAGDPVRLYLGNDVKFLEVRGAYTPDSILGYEIAY